MTPTEFYGDSILDLPIDWQDTPDLLTRLQERLNAYSKLVSEVDASYFGDKSATVEQVRETSRLLLLSLDRRLRGQSAESSFNLSMGHVLGHMRGWTATTFGARVTDKLRLAYRLRRSSKAKLTMADMYHIPFEKRHKVASQRFSIPGLPCLYLAGSTFTCWEEMGRPSFHELHAAAYWIEEKESITFLDLRQTPKAVRELIGERGFPGINNRQDFAAERFRELVGLWPLMAMCMVRVKVRSGSFKPEYFIPQMTLQWIAERGELDGVAYESTHTNLCDFRAINPLANYAFPVKEVELKGRCSFLTKRIRMTPPVSWPLLRALQTHESHPNDQYLIQAADGLEVVNIYTEFGAVERGLAAITHQCIAGLVNNDWSSPS